MRSRFVPLICLPLLLLSACQQQQQQRHNEPTTQEETAQKTPPPLHLGAVHQVYPEQNFALLRIIGPMPGPGVTLITHPPDGSTSRIGNLVISTGQPTRNNIIAADIRSGTVVKGDRVFRYRNIAGHEGKAQDAEADTEEEEMTSESAEPEALPTHTRMPDEEFPTPDLTPAEESASDTVVETPPDPQQAAPPARPEISPTQHAAPAYLNDIPDDISQWD